MKSFSNKVLALSCLALFYVSSMRLIDPSAAIFLQTYFTQSESALTVEMASEIRGIGVEMVLAGFVAIFGIFSPRFRTTAFVVLSMVFVGIVLGSVVSLMVDGIPDQSLFRPLAFETILAGLNVFCLAYNLIRQRTQLEHESVPTL